MINKKYFLLSLDNCEKSSILLPVGGTEIKDSSLIPGLHGFTEESNCHLMRYNCVQEDTTIGTVQMNCRGEGEEW